MKSITERAKIRWLNINGLILVNIYNTCLVRLYRIKYCEVCRL